MSKDTRDSSTHLKHYKLPPSLQKQMSRLSVLNVSVCTHVATQASQLCIYTRKSAHTHTHTAPCWLSPSGPDCGEMIEIFVVARLRGRSGDPAVQPRNTHTVIYECCWCIYWRALSHLSTHTHTEQCPWNILSQCWWTNAQQSCSIEVTETAEKSEAHWAVMRIKNNVQEGLLFSSFAFVHIHFLSFVDTEVIILSQKQKSHRR